MSRNGLLAAALAFSGVFCPGVAGCGGTKTIPASESLKDTDGALPDAVYCSPSLGPIAPGVGVDSGGLSICPGSCKHGAGPQPFGVTPPE